MAENKTGIQQLVVFSLSSEEYGVPITQIQEIIRLPEITRIPGMPGFIEGVINLRGRIIPVIDLRGRFGLEQKERTEKNRIVVADAGGQTVGLVVDGVSEVLQISGEQIDPIPPSMSSIDSEYLSGVAKIDKLLVILLDLAKLLNDLEKTVSGVAAREKNKV
ncbi:MAG: chemotaxis protein CheW [Elusimicrobia bacterium GWA2_56_46]|nr:MAG: chemotaxis protein CheW [Elusimicrobia bacterium GWA2_56_46]OGR55201.1 MAG: chemotaxis protein CheW [Elusimicrobia bacterium GWC2_56_31]HBB66277.1 chemotaxis protein CheW [Elusimicrobiota bacterium]HBW23725.1 chemotaxis protein CheW [Elusimicrobiota bacterium]